MANLNLKSNSQFNTIQEQLFEEDVTTHFGYVEYPEEYVLWNQEEFLDRLYTYQAQHDQASWLVSQGLSRFKMSILKYAQDSDLEKTLTWLQLRKDLAVFCEHNSDLIARVKEVGFMRSISGLTAFCTQYRLTEFKDIRKFLELVVDVYYQGRGIESPYQPCFWAVKEVACNPSYRNLPIWAKKELVKREGHTSNTLYINRFSTSRPGDVWRTLMPAIKAWKWAPQLPKRIASRIGVMGVKACIKAAYVVNALIEDCDYYASSEEKARYICQNFWQEFKALTNARVMMSVWLWSKKPKFRMTIVEIMCELPHKFFNRSYSDLEVNNILYSDEAREEDKITFLSNYSDPNMLCKQLFAVSGKLISKLFVKASINSVRWALQFKGNADQIQKILGSKDLVTYPDVNESDITAFVKGVGLKTLLRVISLTTFKYRGETHEISADHVKDTVMLYGQILDKEGVPEVGRFRCWFSAHEELAKQYVKLLPNFDLKVHDSVAHLQGLCSVDRKWSFEIPTEQAQLVYYGEVLSHCVGGYGAYINEGRAAIIAIYLEGRLIYTIEWRIWNKQISQFYGYGNSYAEDDDKTEVIGILRDTGMFIGGFDEGDTDGDH